MSARRRQRWFGIEQIVATAAGSSASLPPIGKDVLVPLRPRERDGYRSVPELARDLRHSLSLADSEAERGQLAGLTGDTGSAPFGRDAQMSDVFRGGLLAGWLYRRLLERGRPLDQKTMPAVAVYGASIAQGAVAGEFESPDQDVLLKEHTVACVRATRRGCELDEATEQIALEWLADELRLPLTSESLARSRDLRKRRIARLASR